MSEFDIIIDNSQQNLKEVPANVLQMFNLRMLYLQDNFIKELPRDFFPQLPNLTWLDLRNNHLATIPENIAHHKNLENLLLSENKIQVLPIALGMVPKLKVLQVGENPLVYPSMRIITMGTTEILSYLKAQYLKIISPELDTEEAENGALSEVVLAATQPEPVVEAVPSITVTSLSEGERKTVHQVIRNAPEAQVRLKSYYIEDALPQNQANAALQKSWMEKLTELLNQQEKILEQERNLQAIYNWRVNAKSSISSSRSGIKSPIPAPFGTYPEYNAILTREEITKQIDRMIARNEKPPQKDLGKLVNDLSAQLKEIEENYESFQEGTNKEKTNVQIMKIMDVHKRLLQLRQENNRYVP